MLTLVGNFIDPRVDAVDVQRQAGAESPATQPALTVCDSGVHQIVGEDGDVRRRRRDERQRVAALIRIRIRGFRMVTVYCWKALISPSPSEFCMLP